MDYPHHELRRNRAVSANLVLQCRDQIAPLARPDLRPGSPRLREAPRRSASVARQSSCGVAGGSADPLRRQLQPPSRFGREARRGRRVRRKIIAGPRFHILIPVKCAGA
jgi:hypothetical protein